MKRYSALYLLIILLFNACLSIQPAASKTGKNLWEEFFVSPGIMQYFIKPLSFQNKEELFKVDFTFRNGLDSVTVNFSQESKNVIASSVGQVYFLTNKDSIRIKSVQPLLNEKSKKKFIRRKSGKISYLELKQLMSDDQWKISLKMDSTTKKFDPQQKTKRHLQILKNNLFGTVE